MVFFSTLGNMIITVPGHLFSKLAFKNEHSLVYGCLTFGAFIFSIWSLEMEN